MKQKIHLEEVSLKVIKHEQRQSVPWGSGILNVFPLLGLSEHVYFQSCANEVTYTLLTTSNCRYVNMIFLSE